MCDPVSIGITLAIVAGTTGSFGAEGQHQARKDQKKLVEANAVLQRSQVRTNLQETAEANADKQFQLSRKALLARGEVYNQASLGERSVRALGRSIGFDLGQDKATIQRNQKIAQDHAAARLYGINITEESNLVANV